MFKSLILSFLYLVVSGCYYPNDVDLKNKRQPQVVFADGASNSRGLGTDSLTIEQRLRYHLFENHPEFLKKLIKQEKRIFIGADYFYPTRLHVYEKEDRKFIKAEISKQVKELNKQYDFVILANLPDMKNELYTYVDFPRDEDLEHLRAMTSAITNLGGQEKLEDINNYIKSEVKKYPKTVLLDINSVMADLMQGYEGRSFSDLFIDDIHVNFVGQQSFINMGIIPLIEHEFGVLTNISNAEDFEKDGKVNEVKRYLRDITFSFDTEAMKGFLHYRDIDAFLGDAYRAPKGKARGKQVQNKDLKDVYNLGIQKPIRKYKASGKPLPVQEVVKKANYIELNFEGVPLFFAKIKLYQQEKENEYLGRGTDFWKTALGRYFGKKAFTNYEYRLVLNERNPTVGTLYWTVFGGLQTEGGIFQELNVSDRFVPLVVQGNDKRLRERFIKDWTENRDSYERLEFELPIRLEFETK